MRGISHGSKSVHRALFCSSLGLATLSSTLSFLRAIAFAVALFCIKKGVILAFLFPTWGESDQGWQYQHKPYRRMFRKNGIQQSMSCREICLDNAA